MSIINNSAQEQQEASKNWRTLEAQIDKIVDPTNGDLDLKNSNANINGLSVQGKLQQFANEASKIYSLKNLVSKKAAKAHMEGDIHIHDLDYYATKTTTCDQLDLKELFEKGIWNEHGYIRPPKSIGTAAQLAAVVLQSHQNQQHGGQSINNFDFDLAPYVKLSYEKNLKELQKHKATGDLEKLAWKEVENQTLQAMEGFIHNINTMHSRGGGQVVFASINFGLDTTREGRLVSKCLMQAQSNGLGHGETPIFPILCFKVKEGINYNPEDPNYDLFKMTFEVTARRLFPNWVFEDAPFNLAGLDMSSPERMALTSCASMGALRGKERITLKHNNLVYSQIRFDDAFLLIKGKKDIIGNKEEYFSSVSQFEEKCKELGKSPFSSPDKEKLSGIYRITNKRDLKTYIGSSTNIQQRFHDHRARLKVGHFDAGYRFDTPQNPDDFCYDIIELCEKKDFKEKENYYIKKYNTQTFGYNKRDGLDEKDNRAVNPSVFSVKVNKEYKVPFTSDKDEYIKLEDWFVWDEGKWAPVKGIMKISSEGAADIMSIKYSVRGKEYSIDATSDHPFVTNHGRIQVRDLDIDNDKLIADDGSECDILDINFLMQEEDVYDLETFTDTFDVSRIRSHNCRTRLYTDVNGDISTSNKRGNASFTTINLPRLGLLAAQAKDTEDDKTTEFFRLLDEKLELCHDQLLERYKWQCSAAPEEFMYMYQNNTVMGAESWHKTGNIEDCLKHFSLSIGFIGLAEALVALTGFHHGENVKSRNLGLRIVKHMRMYCDRKAEEEHLNWTLLGTPAEGLAGRFTKMDRERFGVIPGVTDREFYTNSSHCFTGDTIVQTATGYKQIKDVKAGDEIITENEETGNLEIDIVEWAGQTKISDKLAVVEFTNGQLELCTPDHPFAKRAFSKGKEVIEWTQAVALRPLDRIESNYQNVQREEDNYVGYVYKLTSSEGHTYIGVHRGKLGDGYITSSSFYKKRKDLDWEKEILKLCYTEESLALWESILILRDKQENEKNVNGNRGLGYSDKSRGIPYAGNTWAALTDIEKRERVEKIQGSYLRKTGYKTPFENPEIQEKCRAGYKEFLSKMDDTERFLFRERKTEIYRKTISSKDEKFFEERSRKMKESRRAFFENGGKVWNKREDIDYDLVSKLYIEGLSVGDIAETLDCSVSLIRRIFFENGGCKLLKKNHQVKSVVIVDYEEPVYDIKMRSNHNFFVGGEDGILVHNCPVYYPISAFDKIDIEAPYHALENAGHIAYIELDGDPSQNLEALEDIVRHMKEAGVGYGAINHPVDTCQECGYSAPMTSSCPQCGSTDIEQLRRITGYLVGSLKRWNPGKKAEEAARVKHTL